MKDGGPPSPLIRYASSILGGIFEILIRFLALAFLVLALPIMLLIAVAIRFDSAGGEIFTQQRIARFSRRPGSGDSDEDRNLDFDVPTFTLYKFRTYSTNSDHLVPKRASFDFDPAIIDKVHLVLKDDPRITRVGRFLRRTSLDELPNLINVVKGDMRLIGPRPEVREVFRYYTDAQRIKFSVKPGITGLAQVNGRGKLTFKETSDYDVWYVQNRTWLLDLYIFLKTFKVVLAGDGSY